MKIMKETTEELFLVKEGELNNTQYFIFKNSKDELRVIEKRAYQSFNLKPGMTLQGRIRRKGCAGEEITELLHPKYIIGETYSLIISRTGTISIDNTVMHFIEVRDNNWIKYTIKVNDSGLYKMGSIVQCILKEQNQGRLVFTVQ
jgi:hypothetical protein